MNEVTYDISAVTGRLSAKIANLEVQLAHEQSAKDAYAKRFSDLEEENGQLQALKKIDEKEAVEDEL